MNFNFDTDIILENKRVRLEPLAAHHYEYLLPIALKYPKLLQYSPSYFGTEKSLKAYINGALEQQSKQTRYAFVIYDKRTQSYAGSTSFGNIFSKHQRLEIGWTWIGKDWQRTGLNRNCKFLLLTYAFETLAFERVELKTDDRNEQSKTAIQAIGAKLEGLLRSHTLMTDGHRRDTVYFSILKKEWAGIKKEIFATF